LRRDDLIPGLIGARIQLDRALILRHGQPDRIPAVTLEQVAVLQQHLPVQSLSEGLFVQRLRREEKALLAGGLVLLEEPLPLHALTSRIAT